MITIKQNGGATISGIKNLDNVIFVIYNNSTEYYYELNDEENLLIRFLLQDTDPALVDINNHTIRFVYDNTRIDNNILYAIVGIHRDDI